jgi:hypothetical protein
MYSIIKERFLNYINSMSFNQEQKNILDTLKLTHTNRVVELSEILAASVFENNNLTEHIELAKIIAVLHDIARWNQMLEYNGFTDVKGDHGKTGADIIVQSDILNGLERSKQQIVLTAICEHNKKIINNYDAFTQIFVDIIRDADRIDNFYIEIENYSEDNSMKNILPFSNEHKLSRRIYESIMNSSLADTKDRETKIDFKFFKMAWIFDIKFTKSIEIIREKKYIEVIYSDINFPDEIMQTAYEKIQQYLKNSNALR